MWDPTQYRRYGFERDRPFFDLLTQVQNAPQTVADLGCGTGHLTATLLERFPTARVWGVDSSAQMLGDANTIPGRLEFVRADLRDWQPPQALNLIVSNAALQWVLDHTTLIPTLVSRLTPHGTLAVQMPANFDAPTHSVLRELTNDPRWNLRAANEPRHAQGLEWYVQMLSGLGFTVNAWETTYQHVLQGENPVLEWVKGTALRPVLAALEPARQTEFLGVYGARLLEAYPARAFGTLLPFKRAFFVAERG